MTSSALPSHDLGTCRRERASALPAEERRQAIVDAVIPLLVEQGAGVTTRQIAAAAGVAEGTIFRVFEDKAQLLHAAAHAALDPGRGPRTLSALDPGLPLEDMVRRAAEHLLERMSEVTAVLLALRGAYAGTERGPRGAGPPAYVLEAHRALLEQLTDLFGRYRDELRVEPARAALVLRALVFGSRQPWTDRAAALTGREIAELLLRGVAAEPGTGARRC